MCSPTSSMKSTVGASKSGSWCAERRADDRKVAAREASAGRARAVERVWAGVDTLPQSQQSTAQRFVGDDRVGGLLAPEAELARHGGMEALNAQPSQCQVEHRDVAEPDDPFWVLAQVAEVDERQQPYRAVTALEADDGFYAGVVDHRLQVGGALGIGTCEIGLLAVGGMRPELNLQAPRFEALAHFAVSAFSDSFRAGVTMPTVSPGRR